MTYQDQYQEKKVTIDEAAQSIKDGDRIAANSVAAMPVDLLKKIENRYEELNNVEIFSSFLTTPFRFLTEPEVAAHVHYNSFFVGALERQYAQNGLFSVTSFNFSNTEEFIKNVVKPNVFVTTAAGMDEDGNFNLGPMGVAQGKLIADVADRVIIQVNKDVPPVKGKSTTLHIDDVDLIFEQDEPLAEIPELESGEIDKQIASHILPEVEDGSTVQIGVGGLSGAVSYGLRDKKDLAVHTEMITQSMMTLAKEGVITGDIVGGFAMGSKDLYNFAGESDQISIEPVYDVVDPYKAGQKDKLISINACLMVDITGQVVSEGAGTRIIAGTGGALDFARAANISEGGKSFFCVRSVNKDKKTGELSSNIKFALPEGTPVTIPRSETDYIATEYGIAHLKNQSISERVRRLIAIAHPEVRDQLTEQAKKVGYISE